MEYRLGTIDDLDEICDLIKDAIVTMEFHGIHQWDELYPARYDFEEDIAAGNLYVAMEGTDLAGLYVISSECDEEYHRCQWDSKDEMAYILHRFCISPKYQNQGIGKQMLLHVENQIRTMGYGAVRLDAFTQNPFALQMYEHNGYATKGYADWRMGRFALMEKCL